jgi:hypothetical protein
MFMFVFVRSTQGYEEAASKSKSRTAGTQEHAPETQAVGSA